MKPGQNQDQTGTEPELNEVKTRTDSGLDQDWSQSKTKPRLDHLSVESQEPS